MRWRFNRRMTLEAVQRTPDGAGGFTEVWQELGQVWADVRAGSGREAAGEEVTLSTVPYRIYLRAAPVASPRP